MQPIAPVVPQALTLGSTVTDSIAVTIRLVRVRDQRAVIRTVRHAITVVIVISIVTNFVAIGIEQAVRQIGDGAVTRIKLLIENEYNPDMKLRIGITGGGGGPAFTGTATSRKFSAS